MSQRMFKTYFTMSQTKNVFVIHIENENWLLILLNLCKEKLIFEGFNIVIIEIFKF
jgi:hypothetical protein